MKVYKDLSDAELIALLKTADDLAFKEIYERYGMMIYYKTNQMIRDEETAKDLVQDVFLSLWTHTDQVKEEANLAGYLYVSARNRVFNLIEKGKTKNDYLSMIAQHLTEASNETVEKLDEKELMGIVRMEIAKLPLKMREVFELSRLEDLSHKEIALRLGISEKTVKTQVHNALQILKEKLSTYGPYGILVLIIVSEK